MKILNKFFHKITQKKIRLIFLRFLLVINLLTNNVALAFAQSPSPKITGSVPENSQGNSDLPTPTSSPTTNLPAESSAKVGDLNPTTTPTPSVIPSPGLPAEEAGPFDEPTPTLTPSPTSSPQITVIPPSLTPFLEPSFAPSVTPNLLNSSLSQNSATIRLPIKISLLSPKNLSARQSLSLKVLNGKDKNLQIKLFKNGSEINLPVRQQIIEEAIILTINPPVAFIPGRYSIKISDETGRVEEQNFIWGVLALNTNKSVYLPAEARALEGLPPELAKISMAVLDENGRMDCQAKLTLKITNGPAKIDDTLSSDNGKITTTPQCKEKNTSNEADYISNYKFTSIGTYNLNLTAQTKNGTYSITDIVTVENNLPFIIERNEYPTRINPAKESEVSLKITANQDFTGQIIEAVPDIFNVASSSATPYHSLSSAVSTPEGFITGTDSPLIIRYPFEGKFPVTLKFGENILDNEEKPLYEKFGLAGHDGVDFALPEGTPIMAVDDGEIILAGAGAYGVTVVLQHSWGRSYYGHLQGTGMALGDKVLKGHKIGLSGKTGLATGPHLHFGIKFIKNEMANGYYGKVNPWPYLTGSSILPGFSVRLISWNLSLKKGQTKELSYRFDAPDISPQFYSLGPIRILKNSSSDSSDLSSKGHLSDLEIFHEQRQWQIAVDAVEPPPSQPEVAGLQSENQKPQKSIIHKGKIIDTNLKENAKAKERASAVIPSEVPLCGTQSRDPDRNCQEKLFRWEVELPNKTVFGFGLQDKPDIKPVVRIRNHKGWYVEFEPNLIELPKVKPKVNGNQIEWDISPGIVARYTALKDRVKADYIVSEKSALDTINNRLSFKVRYNDIIVPDTPENANLTPEDMKDAGLIHHELLPDGSIVWIMENGMTAFENPVPKIIDSQNNEFNGFYEINKDSQGLSFLNINLPQDKINTAEFPITVDPVTIDSDTAAITTATAYGNAKKIMRDAFGNLLVTITAGANNTFYYKSYNSNSWTAATTFNILNPISSDIDSNGNIHSSYVDSNTDLQYVLFTVSRNSDNTISSISGGNTFKLDDSGLNARPSMIIANKGEGAGKEKVAIAWAMNGSKNPKNGQIRFLQCDVADGCDTAAEWKNASEEKDGLTNGLPSDQTTTHAADYLFAVAGTATTHHAVLTQVPGRPARTPTGAFKDIVGSPITLTNAIDDNTGTTETINSLAPGDYIYVGDTVKFSRIVMDVTNTNTNAQTFTTTQYCSANSDTATTCDTWSSLANFIDNTATSTVAMSEDGSILFDEPSTWIASTENSTQGFWTRFSPSGIFDSTVSIAEIDVTDRHSKDLLVVGGEDNTNDMGAAYVIWNFIGQAGWENIPGNTTAPAPWKQVTTTISSFSPANWTDTTNFPLTITTDYINNIMYIAYHECAGTACATTNELTVRYKKNNASLTVGWSNVNFPSVTEGTDLVLSLTSDQNDIYLFYILDPESNALVYRKCQPNGGGTLDICDNSADWNAEQTLDSDITLSHPQAIVSKAFGDTTAIDVIYTDTTDTDVRYERHYVNMADTTEVITESGDDAFQRDCDDSVTDDQDITATTIKLGRENDDASCSASTVESENHVGLRFQTINIAQGAAISSAYLDFRVITDAAGSAVDFTIYGEDVDDSAAFSALTNCTPGVNCTAIISERSRTTTSTSQSINFETQSYRIDVTDSIQEIICRGYGSSQPCVGNYSGSGTWAANNDLSLLLISSEGGTTDNNALITALDDTSTVMLDPTLQINLGNTSKKYSMEVTLPLTNDKSDLDHPMETEEFTAVNTDDSLIASVSASLVPSASSSAVPQFLFKVNNTNNNNTDDLSASAIVKSTINSNTSAAPVGKSLYLQLYKAGTGWETKDTESATAADTDITLSSGTVSSTTTNYATESPGGSCSGSDCWISWRVYQDAAPEGNQILYVDHFSNSFISPTPTPASGPTTDQQIRHGAWWLSGVEQPFTF